MCLIDGSRQLLDINRLLQIGKGAELHTNLSILLRTMTGKDDNFYIGFNFLGFTKYLDAIHSGHSQVKDHYIRSAVITGNQIEGLLAIMDRIGTYIPVNQSLGNSLRQLLFIINKKNL